MDDLFQQLEFRIKKLINQCDQLKSSNRHLKQNQFVLAREKDSLVHKNKTAIAQIEKMVTRLKLIENAS